MEQILVREEIFLHMISHTLVLLPTIDIVLYLYRNISIIEALYHPKLEKILKIGKQNPINLEEPREKFNRNYKQNTPQSISYILAY
jgi:hypothetical protein